MPVSTTQRINQITALLTFLTIDRGNERTYERLLSMQKIKASSFSVPAGFVISSVSQIYIWKVIF